MVTVASPSPWVRDVKLGDGSVETIRYPAASSTDDGMPDYARC